MCAMMRVAHVARKSAAAAMSTVVAGCSVLGVQTAAVVPPSVPASPAQSGEIYSGTEDCAYYARDGDYTAYALMQNVNDCAEVSSALASFGRFWSPVTYSTVTALQEDGDLPNADRYCLLDGNGGMTLAVYEVSSVAEPIGSGLAGQICQSEEQNGWTPAQAQ